jgi:anti-anti-sigma regulatory factor
LLEREHQLQQGPAQSLGGEKQMSIDSSMVVVLPKGDYGSLSLSTLQRLQKQLMDLADYFCHQPITLDFSMVQRMGAALLSTLIELNWVLKRRNQHLTVRGLNPYQEGLFQVTHIDQLVTVL